ncbi:BnaA05g35360D [Brassica napus]|uniref:BnaA05g35360D protein n=1 Tax=Brassica napus TaxID=3708 RepID=A0A078J850_BRANA|nr:BnaA05g35360D [Brassica napus]
MGFLHKQYHSFVILLLFGFLAISYACECSDPPKPSPPPPYTPCPPTAKPPPPPTPSPPPPYVKPPPPPTPSPPPPTLSAPPPYVKPPPPPTPSPPPPYPPPPPTPSPPPPYVKPPPPPTPSPPPPPTPCPPPPPAPTPKPKTCSINVLKLGACVDVLGGLIHVGLGKGYAKTKCCPVLDGLVGLDAAVCLCSSIRAKLLNIDLVIPIALELLIDCGKTPPRDFKCPAPQQRNPLLG